MRRLKQHQTPSHIPAALRLPAADGERMAGRATPFARPTSSGFGLFLQSFAWKHI